MSTLDSIDLDVLSSKLNALRTTEMRQMAQNDQKSGFEATHAVKSNYSQTRPTTQTFRTPTRSTGDDDKIAYSQYKPNMMSRPSNTAKVSASPTVSPLRGGQSNRSQSSTPANRAPSPYGTNRRFASPAKIFGGRSSRGSSPSPVMKIAGFFRRKGNDSRHASPMRKSETSVPSVATTSVAAKRRSSNELSFLSDFAVNSFRSSINTVDSSGQDMLLPPRPTSIVVSTKCSKGTTEHFTQLRDTPKPSKFASIFVV